MKPIVWGLVVLMVVGCQRDDISQNAQRDAGGCVATAEECNGLDDDCDGLADETTVGQGLPCRVGLGACSREGVQACFGGQLECDVIAAEPGIEGCDGLDNDCDGDVDEDAGPGCRFANADGVCRDGECIMSACAPGFFDLDGDATNGCEADCAPQNGGVEACNAADDDCDGLTDEGFELATSVEDCGACGRVCAFENARAQCVGGQCQIAECDEDFRDLDRDLENGCEFECLIAQAEACDAQDNDCDGRIDEDADGACGGERGECTPGILACVDGQFVACSGVEPSEELCDGLDNDCDGTTDEAFDLQTSEVHCGECDQPCAPANAAGICVGGICGIENCERGFGDVDRLPGNGCETECAPEVCDLLDNDCDGRADEGFDLESDLEHCGMCDLPCEAGNATPLCEAGRCTIGACPANTTDLNGDVADGCEYVCFGDVDTPEACDGDDDDCDGRVDEGFDTHADVNHCGGCNQVCAPDNAAAACDAGRCVIVECDDGFTNLDLDVETGCECEFGAEECNGEDDDCDGAVDERLVPQPCGSARGVCVTGMTACQEGAWGPCQGQVDPSPETCDGRDEDCDGQTDEDSVSDPVCQTGVPGVCAQGASVCDAGRLGCVVPPPAEEICDGLDNDCDDRTDEAAPAECDTGELGACAVGIQQCIAGAPECAAPAPAVEGCDGQDNDCDGETDEGLEGTCCFLTPDDPPCNDCFPDTVVPDGWVCIPPGEFRMGSEPPRAGQVIPDNERPSRAVTITQAFFMQTTEVVVAEWNAFMPQAQFARECGDLQQRGCPVVSINWYEAVAYANARSVAEELEECYQLSDCDGIIGQGLNCDQQVVFHGIECLGYRLPTEAEWEYATRAGTTTAYSFDEEADRLELHGWYRENSVDGRGDSDRHPVGQLEPNRWGLYDVHGNVSEWIFDWFDLYSPEDQFDPVVIVPAVIAVRVIRSGDFTSEANALRSPARTGLRPHEFTRYVGIRLVRTIL